MRSVGHTGAISLHPACKVRIRAPGLRLRQALRYWLGLAWPRRSQNDSVMCLAQLSDEPGNPGNQRYDGYGSRYASHKDEDKPGVR